jgi:uncharacterized protein (DUF885 family)
MNTSGEKRSWLVALALAFAACAEPAAESTPPVASRSAAVAVAASAPKKAEPACAIRKDLDAIVDEWLARFPNRGRSLGLHEWDGKLQDHSREGIQKTIAWLGRTKQRLDQLDAGKDPDCILDRKLELHAVELALFELVDREEWQRNPMYYSELFSVDDYLDRDYAPLVVRVGKLVEHQEAALAQVEHVEKNLATPLPKPIVETSIKVFDGYAAYLKSDVPKQVEPVTDDALKQRFRKANGELAKAAARIAAKLKKTELPRADQSWVLGIDRYKKLLSAQEGLNVPLATLEKMADENLKKNGAEYAKLKESTKITRPKAKDLFASAQALVTESREFVAKKALVTLPAGEKITVKETPAYMRWNQAFLNAPGPFETGDTEAFYYITLPDPKWPKKEQDEYILPFGVLVATSVHEVFPGHFLQGLWMKQAPTRPQKVFESYSFSEGWAHYTEELMVEQGFQADRPEVRLGQLSDALLRNCRFVVSLAIHTRAMTLADAEKKFMEACHQDKATAREQAIRGTFDPGYFAYTLGKLQILALRDKAKQKLGARFSLRRFHDALLSHGGPPVPLIEERVLAELDAAR